MAALIRWNPNGGLAVRPFFRPFRLLEEVEEMAKTAFESGITPKMDMYEDEKEIVVKAEMPGISKSDLDIKLDGEMLSIKAEKKEEEEVKEATHYTRERRFGKYVRYMTLPSRVDTENVSASLKKGLLEIKLPKAEGPDSKQIEIKVK